MKKIFLFFSLILLTSSLAAQEIDITKIKFKIDKTSLYAKTFSSTRKDIFNIAYSSVLPNNAIYKVVCTSNHREAIIQIGYSMANTTPDTIYVPDYLYSFFGDNDPGLEQNPEVKLLFLGWSEGVQNGETDFLNIQSLVIPPEKAENEIKANGGDKYYIQLGSFSYYQNSYPKITMMLPYLELKPNFFMMEYKNTATGSKVYRVLAGPYSQEDALKIAKSINNKNAEPVFIKAGNTIIKQDK